MYLSVIMPSFNETRNIEAGALEKVYEYLKSGKYQFELILSDDGSTDGTTAKLHEFAREHAGVKVLANAHQGKGPTVIAGLMAAKGEYRLFTDFDQATPIAEIARLLPYVEDGYDVAIGSREGKGALRKKEPFYRHLMGRVFNFAVRTLTIGGLKDTQCGFKLFSAAAVNELCPKVVVYGGKGRKDAFTGAFDVELLYLARKYGYKIAEVPVVWKHVATDRVSPIKDSVRMFIDLLKIRLADLSGKYDEVKK